MVKVSFIKPFYTKLAQGRLRMVFAYQYLAIEKDGELFHFIPIEGKEIIYDCYGESYENEEEVFVFQRGNRFIRLKIKELLKVEGVKEALELIIEDVSSDTSSKKEEKRKGKVKPLIRKKDSEEDFFFRIQNETDEIMAEIEEMNRKNYIHAEIEVALATGDKERFMEFSEKLKEEKN